ncbi:hypothetical protein L1887_37355 [Cichorium endivia]|nr:hypothetical protein L1887_37355 [Cichorium endivia]
MAELLNRFLHMVSNMFNHDLIAIHMLSLTLLLLNVDLLLLFLHIRFLLRLALLMRNSRICHSQPFPVSFFANQFVDLGIEISEMVFAQTLAFNRLQGDGYVKSETASIEFLAPSDRGFPRSLR